MAKMSLPFVFLLMLAVAPAAIGRGRGGDDAAPAASAVGGCPKAHMDLVVIAVLNPTEGGGKGVQKATELLNATVQRFALSADYVRAHITIGCFYYFYTFLRRCPDPGGPGALQVGTALGSLLLSMGPNEELYSMAMAWAHEKVPYHDVGRRRAVILYGNTEQTRGDPAADAQTLLKGSPFSADPFIALAYGVNGPDPATEAQLRSIATDPDHYFSISYAEAIGPVVDTVYWELCRQADRPRS